MVHPTPPQPDSGTPSSRRAGDSPLSPHTRTTIRLAVVAVSVIVTLGALLGVTLQARRAERALAETATSTLHDYLGYAGRLMGSEMLRRFSEQRARVLAPVLGSDGRNVPAPNLADIASRGEHELANRGLDPGRGYFRLDLRTGDIEGRGVARGDFARRIADTLRVLASGTSANADPAIMVMEADSIPVSVAYATLRGGTTRDSAVYGFTYSRSLGIAYWARTVFRETPLLPPSFAGQRWNFDTTRVQPGEVLNDAVLSVRVTDRTGRPFWQSTGAPSPVAAIRESAVISTSAGGMIIETTLLAGREPRLVPAAYRQAQRWSMRAVIALTLMLAALALFALRAERAMARIRRVEAMEQLALGIRHELNNALASVLLNAELMSEEPGLDEGARERVVAIAEQAGRMRDVLRRLEQREHLDVIVPYLDAGFMVDLSPPSDDPMDTRRRGR